MSSAGLSRVLSKEKPVEEWERPAPSVPAFTRVVIACLAASFDYASIFTGTIAGTLAVDAIQLERLPHSWMPVFIFSLEYGFVFFVCALSRSLYTPSHSLLKVRDTAEIIRVSTYSLVLYSLVMYLRNSERQRLIILVSWILITALLTGQRHLTCQLLVRLKASRAAQRRVAIFGTGRDARRLYSFLVNSPEFALLPVAFIDEENTAKSSVIYSLDYWHRSCAPVIGARFDRELIDDLRVDEIYISQSDLSQHRTNEIVALAAENSITVSFVGIAYPFAGDRHSSVRVMDGLMVTSANLDTQREIFYSVAKRGFDVVASIVLLIVSLPLWLFAAVWVKGSSRGPVLFRQERIGRGGRPFGMYKFRSMYVNAPRYSSSPRDPEDPRITPAGRFLRRTSLDELPQLINVIRGDMSLVGPRPEMPYVVEQYGSVERQRLSVPQGITGLWQLSADRKYSIHQSLEYDLYYIENRSFFLDIALLLHTFLFAMNGV
jgi:exopolysaccharide biosynthesis polyprenyl glycosylphosphotransferase